MVSTDFSAVRTHEGAWPVITDQCDVSHPGYQPWAQPIYSGMTGGAGEPGGLSVFTWHACLFGVPVDAEAIIGCYCTIQERQQACCPYTAAQRV